MATVRRHRGFSLIELMIVVVIIGILAAVAVPAFVSHMRKAKTSEAHLQLNKLGKNAKTYYQANTTFPQGTAAGLPGADGTACTAPDKRFAASASAWAADTVWTVLDFQLDEPSLFTYHYTSASPTSGQALAVGDLDCDGTMITYSLALSVPSGQPAAVISAPPANAD